MPAARAFLLATQAVGRGGHRLPRCDTLAPMSKDPSATDISVRVVGEEGPAIRLSVRVAQAGTETEHQVTLDRNFLARLAPGEPAERFVRRSFVFLLEREPKESILRRFDVSIVSRYFPEFEKTIRTGAAPARDP